MKKERACKLPVDPRYGVAGLSWSSLCLVETQPEVWYDRYVLGKKKPPNKSMLYGTHVHALIAHRKLTGPLKGTPIGENPERKLLCRIYYTKTKYFNLLGKPDDFNSDTLFEYKTGLTLWSRKQAEEHGQLPTYALLIKNTRGIIINRATLVSFRTKTTENGIVLTGEKAIHTNIPITSLDMLKIQARFINGYHKALEIMKQKNKVC